MSFLKIQQEFANFELVDNPIKWQYSDAGRRQTKWKGSNDCAVRAFALAIGMSYDDARHELKRASKNGVAQNRRISAGVFTKDITKVLAWYLWEFVKFSEPKQLIDLSESLPNKVILSMPSHVAYLEGNVLYDTWDSRNEPIKGYWFESSLM